MTLTERELINLYDERMPDHIQTVIHDWFDEPMTTQRYNILKLIAGTPRPHLHPLYIYDDKVFWVNPEYTTYIYKPKTKKWEQRAYKTKKYPTLLPLYK